MEVYQWLLRQREFEVSDTGYFVYANTSKDEVAFDRKLVFDVMLIPCKGKADWIDETLLDIKQCLDSEQIPPMDPDCDYCRYREAAGQAFQAQIAKKKKCEDIGAPLRTAPAISPIG
jgi:hypothetical protein